VKHALRPNITGSVERLCASGGTIWFGLRNVLFWGHKRSSESCHRWRIAWMFDEGFKKPTITSNIWWNILLVQCRLDKNIDDKARGYDFLPTLLKPSDLLNSRIFHLYMWNELGHIENLTGFLFVEMYFYKIGSYKMVNSKKYPGCIIEDLLDTFLSAHAGWIWQFKVTR